MEKEIKLDRGERKLLSHLRKLFKQNRAGRSQTVTITKVGEDYEIGSIARKGIIRSK